MDRWVVLVSAGLATAAPVAIGLRGEPWWIIALAFVGSFAGVVAGWRGLSKPGDRLGQGDGPNPRDIPGFRR